MHRSDTPAVDETLLPPTPGRRVYERACIQCHGKSREGTGASPSLLGLSDAADFEIKLANELLPVHRGGSIADGRDKSAAVNDLRPFPSFGGSWSDPHLIYMA